MFCSFPGQWVVKTLGDGKGPSSAPYAVEVLKQLSGLCLFDFSKPCVSSCTFREVPWHKLKRTAATRNEAVKLFPECFLHPALLGRRV